MSSELSSIEQRRTWIGAVAIVGLIYAAALGIAILVKATIETDTEVDAAFVVELAPIVTASMTPIVEAPVGPLRPDVAPAVSEASAAANTKPLDAIDLPPLPTPSDVPPQLLAAKPPVDPKPERVTAASSAPSVKTEVPSVSTPPSVAAAPPPAAAVTPTPRPSSAPTRGRSEQDRRAIQRWQSALAAHLALFKQRPPEASRTELVATVAFAIDRAGRVVSVGLVRSSGRPGHDATALAIVRRASPVPAPPTDVLAAELSFVLPIRFEPGK